MDKKQEIINKIEALKKELEEINKAEIFEDNFFEVFHFPYSDIRKLIYHHTSGNPPISLIVFYIYNKGLNIYSLKFNFDMFGAVSVGSECNYNKDISEVLDCTNVINRSLKEISQDESFVVYLKEVQTSKIHGK